MTSIDLICIVILYELNPHSTKMRMQNRYNEKNYRGHYLSTYYLLMRYIVGSNHSSDQIIEDRFFVL